MLKIKVSNLKHYYGDRLILNIEDFKVYNKDRIGIVGLNGAGKTTLLNILTKKIIPTEGTVTLLGKHSYITQLQKPISKEIDPKMADKLNIDSKNINHLSGGEKTRLKIAQSLSEDVDILFADEPTCNLDMNGISILEEMLSDFKGSLLLISHDRELLDNFCNKIIEIENGKVKEYCGNYSDYKKQKLMELEREGFEYDQYVKEKKKLENAITNRKEKASSMKKTPTRMGNSEARLHKRSTTAKQAKVNQASKALKTRIEKLEKKKKPREHKKTRIDIPAIGELHSKVIIEGEKISKSFGNRVLFKNLNFQIHNGDKVALIGNNGAGKTTLVRMILSGDEGIRVSQKAKIAYFSQELETLKEELTILENVMEDSIHSETFVRTLLSRLLFRNDDVHKKINILSGGERVKVAFAKIFVGNINMIILDEPTNFLDVESIESLEGVIEEYNGTLLFVSHDRRFIDKVANKLFVLKDKNLILFNGSYTEYKKSIENKMNSNQEALHKKLLLLENRLSEITSKLSVPSKGDDLEALDREFKEIIQEINDVKKQ